MGMVGVVREGVERGLWEIVGDGECEKEGVR